MASTTVSDYVIWAKHIHDDPELVQRVLARFPGAQIVAVNGVSYDPDRLKGAIKEARQPGAGIELLVKNGERYGTVRFDYHDGLRYPRLHQALLWIFPALLATLSLLFMMGKWMV